MLSRVITSKNSMWSRVATARMLPSGDHARSFTADTCHFAKADTCPPLRAVIGSREGGRGVSTNTNNVGVGVCVGVEVGVGVWVRVGIKVGEEVKVIVGIDVEVEVGVWVANNAPNPPWHPDSIRTIKAIMKIYIKRICLAGFMDSKSNIIDFDHQ